MNLIAQVFITSSLIFVPVLSTTSIQPPAIEIPLEAPKSPVIKTSYKTPTPTPSQIALIAQKAEQYNVSADLMTKIIACESGFNENALGDYGQSRGLVQIHRPSHPQITDAMAYDPEFAITFLAENLSKGNGSMWTCYRNLARSG